MEKLEGFPLGERTKVCRSRPSTYTMLWSNLSYELQTLLRGWVIHPPLLPRFEAAVWRRIRRTVIAPINTTSLAKLLFSRILDSLARPAWACAFVMLFILVGVLSGLIESRRVAARVSEDLRARYVQTVAPSPGG